MDETSSCLTARQELTWASMANLYDLMGEYSELQQAAEDPNVDEEQFAALVNQLDEARGELKDKVDRIAKVLRNLDADCRKLKFEEQRLAQRRKAMENNAESLRNWVRTTMDLLDVDRIKTDMFTVTLGKPTFRVEVLNEKEVPPEYVRTEIKVDKKAVLKAAQTDGEIVPGCDVRQGPRKLTFR